MQSNEETVNSYVNRLRKCASSCQFDSLTDMLIRDRLVVGFQDKSTKLSLLKEENLGLNNAIYICRSNEIASQQQKSMKLDGNEEEGVDCTKTTTKEFFDKEKNNP